MNKSYKIYYNDSFLLITDDRSQLRKKFAKIIRGEDEIGQFLRDPVNLFHAKNGGSVLAFASSPDAVMRDFREKITLVIAGGGIVKNEKNELLMIFRRGKWDLPKGKIEVREEILSGAIREVNEETGVKIASADARSIITFHAYHLKGKNCLKETHWYEMKAEPGQIDMVAQADEGIEEVRWIKKGDIAVYRKECYPLVRDLISATFPRRLAD